MPRGARRSSDTSCGNGDSGWRGPGLQCGRIIAEKWPSVVGTDRGSSIPSTILWAKNRTTHQIHRFPRARVCRPAPSATILSKRAVKGKKSVYSGTVPGASQAQGKAIAALVCVCVDHGYTSVSAGYKPEAEPGLGARNIASLFSSPDTSQHPVIFHTLLLFADRHYGEKSQNGTVGTRCAKMATVGATSPSVAISDIVHAGGRKKSRGTVPGGISGTRKSHRRSDRGSSSYLVPKWQR